MVFYLMAFAVGVLISHLLKLKKTLYILAVILSLLCAFLLTQYLSTIPSETIEIKILQPNPQFETRSKILKVSGTVSVPNCHIYVLIHPAKTDLWYVQSLPKYVDSKPQQWQVECYLGTNKKGLDDTYDIVALVSNGNLLLDILKNRYMYPGQRLKELPLLSKSNVVTVKRNR